MIEAGQPAPDFTAQTTDGRTVRLADLGGRAVVLYFFPRAFTYGCTIEAQQFKEAYPEIQKLGAELYGVSPDSHPTQCDFAGHLGIPFPMIGDEDMGVGEKFGVPFPFVKRYRRVSFVIDDARVVRSVIKHEIMISRHREDVLECLTQLARERAAKAG